MNWQVLVSYELRLRDLEKKAKDSAKTDIVLTILLITVFVALFASVCELKLQYSNVKLAHVNQQCQKCGATMEAVK